MLPLLATLLSLSAATAAAQSLDVPTDAPFRTGFGLADVDGGVLAIGPGWRASFETDRVEFTPAFPTDHGHVPLALTLDSVRRERGDSLEFDTAVAPSREGASVRFDRGTLLERYAISSEGIEQSFLLERLPQGSGDLVVRLDLETTFALEVRAEGASLRYAEGLGVDVGAVTAIDATGRRVPGALRGGDGFLELVVPAAFVDAASLPLLVDPFLLPVVDSGATNVLHSGVFFDETSGNFLITFGQTSGFATDLVARVLYEDDSLSPWTVLDANIGWVPDAAGDAVQSTLYANGVFVLAWTDDVAITSADTFLKVATVDATTGALLDTVTFAGSFSSPDVWGVGTTLGAGGATILYVETSVGVRARTVRVEPDGSIVTSGGLPALGATTIAPTGASTLRATRLARSAPFEFSGTTYGQTLAVWKAGGDLNLQLLGAAETPVVLGSPITLPTNQGPTARVDGDGEEFFVAYPTGVAGNQELSRVDVLPGGGLQATPLGSISPNPGLSTLYVDLCLVGPQFDVVYEDGGSLFLAPWFRASHVTLGADDLTVPGAQLIAPSIATDHPSDGGLVRHGGVVVFQQGSAAKAVRFRNFEGTAVDVSSPCGATSLSLSGGLPAVGNSDFALFVENPLPFQALPLLNLIPGAPQPFPCGPCTLALGTGTLYVSSSGSFQFPIPIDAGLINFRATASGGVLLPVGVPGGGCFFTPRLIFTNILDMTIQN